MKNYLLLVFSFAALTTSAQNLVPNPDFEIIMNPSCWVYGTNLNANVASWSAASVGTPDLITDNGLAPTCEMSATGSGAYWGRQTPRSGQSMLAVITYCSACASETREYVQAQLTTPLTVGTAYYAEMYVSFADFSGWFTNNFGMHFSVNSYTGPSWLSIPVTPQIIETNVVYDSSGWYLISGTFIADSAYEYVTIGNYKDDSQTTLVNNPSAGSFTGNYGVYFVDDMKVEAANQLPTALFSAPNHICPGTCTSFQNLSINGTTYLWSFPGGVPSTSTDVSPSNICYATTGNYSVELIATNANGSDTLTLVNYITVYPSPSPQGITQAGDTLFANAGAVSYQWYLGGNAISGATNYFYVALSGGDYNVVATDVNGCEVEAAIFDVVASVKSTEPDPFSLHIFPNPAGNKVEISLSDNVSGKITLGIYNAIGQLVLAAEKDSGERNISVDINTLQPGFYLVELIDGVNSYRNMLIKK